MLTLEQLGELLAQNGEGLNARVAEFSIANVREVGDFDFGSDPVQLMYDYFARQIQLACQCGVEKILIDPGLGFYYRNLQDSAVRVGHQMRVFLNTFRLRKLGYPVCHALP